MKKPWTPWVERINDGSPVVHIWRLHLVDWPFRFYLHHLRRPDNDRFMHNHPRPWVSLVLWGGYVERTCANRHSGARLRDVGRPFGRRGPRLNAMSVERFHQIVHVEPHTFTLLLGRYRTSPDGWGFLAPESRHVIPADQWVNHPARSEGRA